MENEKTMNGFNVIEPKTTYYSVFDLATGKAGNLFPAHNDEEAKRIVFMSMKDIPEVMLTDLELDRVVTFDASFHIVDNVVSVLGTFRNIKNEIDARIEKDKEFN